MKLNQLILPVVALGTAAAFLTTGAQEAEGYSLIGGSLNLQQRDFRVFNNFTGNTDNNNQTPDANFPGYQGAVMAIWKGSIEWGSEPHGNGAGDPTQSELGSGNANFDPSFQGEANGVGNTNENIHSQLSGSNGGVLAYCETPISDGWRIRYYEGWTWSDGPGGAGGNQIDLQEVACHEYGHALGLGHSNVSGATMLPSYSGGTSGRSINNDDRAGLAAIYGAANSNKPIVTGVTVSGSVMTISGTGFDNSGNTVWFTQANSGGNGQPVKVSNVSSSNGGTEISVTIPGNAGPGDVLVQRNGTGNGALSNSWPDDLTPDGPPPPTCGATNYCTSLPNSTGASATITSFGSASVAANDLQLDVFGCPPNKTGVFFFGPNQVAVLFGDGLRCVGGSIKRLGVTSTDIFGFAQVSLDITSSTFTTSAAPAVPGGITNFQFWYRDPGFATGFNLSDGLEVEWCD